MTFCTTWYYVTGTKLWQISEGKIFTSIVKDWVIFQAVMKSLLLLSRFRNKSLRTAEQTLKPLWSPAHSILQNLFYMSWYKPNVVQKLEDHDSWTFIKLGKWYLYSIAKDASLSSPVICSGGCFFQRDENVSMYIVWVQMFQNSNDRRGFASVMKIVLEWFAVSVRNVRPILLL